MNGNGPKAMTKAVLSSHRRFAARSFKNASVSARLFSAQNVAPLLVNPSNVTKEAIFVGASSHTPGSPTQGPRGVPEKEVASGPIFGS